MIVNIPSAPANQPTVSADTTISAIGGSGAGGGTISVGAGAALTIAAATIQSSVTFQGTTAGCTTCKVVAMNLTVSKSKLEHRLRPDTLSPKVVQTPPNGP
jgi:hypothetical protein